MNKAKVYCVASAVAVCVASNPNMDVLAKQVQPVKLEEKAQQTITADDFIKQYLSTKEIVKDSTNKDVEKYTLITKVDEKNYSFVLAGDQLFKVLTKENQDQIKKAYEDAYSKTGMKKAEGCNLSAYDIIVAEANTLIINAKNALDSSLKDAQSLDSTIFTANSYATLKTVMDESSQLLGSTTSTLEQLTLELSKLDGAKKALINISGLKAIVDQSSTYGKDSYTTRSYTAYETSLNEAKKVLENGASTVEDITKAQSALNAAATSLVKKADFSKLNETVQEASEVLESDKDMLEEESYNNFKKELDACSLVLSNDESTQEKIDETLAHLNAYLEDNSNFVYKVVTLEEKVAPKVEASNELLAQTPIVQEQPQVVVPTVETKNVEAAKVETVVKQEVTSTAADNFIKTYLTSASGNIFTSANNLNYQKILSAMPSWVKLSTADKNAVNAELVNKVGKKYQRLLQEAQKFSMSAGKYTPVNTSTNTNVSIYSWLCMMSLGALTFALKRLRKQD
ncbi:hypothetical protein [uncultured Holdemanella sp.]|uniref:hypothetical protein n=1 Tax=uncultured Holdemanella sp. TaxID=1763549 RepID=UPI0025D9219A|nr:hypothetical protein [uncultured Holdemanella sp.]